MNLHEDVETFRALLSVIETRTGIHEDIIDFYVTISLNELSQKQGDALRIFQRWSRAL